MTDKEFEELERKQQLIIDSWVAIEDETGRDPTLTEVADRAYDTCSTTYVTYVMDKYGDLLDERRNTMSEPIADGEGQYVFELGTSDTWKAIRLLPEELSRKIYNQVREE